MYHAKSFKKWVANDKERLQYGIFNTKKRENNCRVRFLRSKNYSSKQVRSQFQTKNEKTDRTSS